MHLTLGVKTMTKTRAKRYGIYKSIPDKGYTVFKFNNLGWIANGHELDDLSRYDHMWEAPARSGEFGEMIATKDLLKW